jgi:hypothetical protein
VQELQCVACALKCCIESCLLLQLCSTMMMMMMVMTVMMMKHRQALYTRKQHNTPCNPCSRLLSKDHHHAPEGGLVE